MPSPQPEPTAPARSPAKYDKDNEKRRRPRPAPAGTAVCVSRVRCRAPRPPPTHRTGHSRAEPGELCLCALAHHTTAHRTHLTRGAATASRRVACSQRGGVGLRAAALCDRTIMRKYMRVHSYQRIRTRCEMSVLLRSGPIGCSSSSDIADPVACRRASVTLHVTRERPQHHGSLWLVYGHGGAKLHLVPRLGLIPDRRRLERRCGCTRGWGGRVDGES